jgi:hypothetical protein
MMVKSKVPNLTEAKIKFLKMFVFVLLGCCAKDTFFSLPPFSLSQKNTVSDSNCDEEESRKVVYV